MRAPPAVAAAKARVASKEATSEAASGVGGAWMGRGPETPVAGQTGTAPESSPTPGRSPPPTPPGRATLLSQALNCAKDDYYSARSRSSSGGGADLASVARMASLGDFSDSDPESEASTAFDEDEDESSSSEGVALGRACVVLFAAAVAARSLWALPLALLLTLADAKLRSVVVGRSALPAHTPGVIHVYFNVIEVRTHRCVSRETLIHCLQERPSKRDDRAESVDPQRLRILSRALQMNTLLKRGVVWGYLWRASEERDLQREPLERCFNRFEHVLPLPCSGARRSRRSSPLARAVGWSECGTIQVRGETARRRPRGQGVEPTTMAATTRSVARRAAAETETKRGARGGRGGRGGPRRGRPS